MSRQQQARQNSVFNLLKMISNNPAGYFCYDDNYCELVNCDKPNCDKHFGSVLAVEYHSDTNACYLGAIIHVGSIHDYTVRLNTRTGILSATNGRDTFRIPYKADELVAVDNHWADTYATLMR